MAGEEETVDVGEEATEHGHSNHTDHQGSEGCVEPWQYIAEICVLWCIFYKDHFGCSAESKLKWGQEQADQISLSQNKRYAAVVQINE